jgi:hypothetical protein
MKPSSSKTSLQILKRRLQTAPLSHIIEQSVPNASNMQDQRMSKVLGICTLAIFVDSGDVLKY